MNLATLIQNYNFVDTMSGDRLKVAMDSGKPVIVFDCTDDSLFYRLFGKYVGADREFVGLIPDDFKALLYADDVRVDEKHFLLN